MMKSLARTLGRILVAALLCLSLTSCEPPQVYGSIGYSSFSGGYGSPGFGTSLMIGGRIY